MQVFSPVFIMFIVFLAGRIHAQKTVPATEGNTSSQINDVHGIQSEVMTLVNTGKLKASEVSYPGDHLSTEKLYLDQHGVTRLKVLEVKNRSTSFYAEYYYSGDGSLRLLHSITGGDVGEACTAYYNEQGECVWEVLKTEGGEERAGVGVLVSEEKN